MTGARLDPPPPAAAVGELPGPDDRNGTVLGVPGAAVDEPEASAGQGAERLGVVIARRDGCLHEPDGTGLARSADHHWVSGSDRRRDRSSEAESPEQRPGEHVRLGVDLPPGHSLGVGTRPLRRGLGVPEVPGRPVQLGTERAPTCHAASHSRECAGSGAEGGGTLCSTAPGSGIHRSRIIRRPSSTYCRVPLSCTAHRELGRSRRTSRLFRQGLHDSFQSPACRTGPWLGWRSAAHFMTMAERPSRRPRVPDGREPPGEYCHLTVHRPATRGAGSTPNFGNGWTSGSGSSISVPRTRRSMTSASRGPMPRSETRRHRVLTPEEPRQHRRRWIRIRV